MKKNCLCGDRASHVAWFEVRNVYSRIGQVVEEKFVCHYHATESENKGLDVETFAEYSRWRGQKNR